MGILEGHVAIDPPTGCWSGTSIDTSLTCSSEPDNYYAELRAKGPFVYIPKYASLACGRYDVTKEVFSDWHRFVFFRGAWVCRIFSSRSPGGPRASCLRSIR